MKVKVNVKNQDGSKSEAHVELKVTVQVKVEGEMKVGIKGEVLVKAIGK